MALLHREDNVGCFSTLNKTAACSIRRFRANEPETRKEKKIDSSSDRPLDLQRSPGVSTMRFLAHIQNPNPHEEVIGVASH